MGGYRTIPSTINAPYAQPRSVFCPQVLILAQRVTGQGQGGQTAQHDPEVSGTLCYLSV